jgi:RNA-directed DNA polymerase
VVSPLIANVSLHYVFDLWAEVWRKKVAKGDVVVVRYADDCAPRAQKAERLSSA